MDIISAIDKNTERFPEVNNFLRTAWGRVLVLSYYWNVLRGKPYFGRYLRSSQLLPERADFMKKLVRNAVSERDSISILEIGSWAGASAVLWAETAKLLLPAGKIKVMCVDIWGYYPSFETTPYTRHVKQAARSGKIFQMFLHNIAASGVSDVIISVKTSSRVASNYFRSEQFDIVFIDGDHSYSSVSSDINEYAPLVSEGGYICGDDLELQLSELDPEFLKQHLQDDWVTDPRSGKEFHPGISLAVGQYFGDVSRYNGFWIMQKRPSNNWRKVGL